MLVFLNFLCLGWCNADKRQGESLASVFENITKAAHLNVTKNLLTSVGPQLLLQSSLFTRVGMDADSTDD